MSNKVLVIGLGDLARRIILQSSGLPSSIEWIVASRQEESGKAFCALAAACLTHHVRFLKHDALDVGATCELLKREEPDVIVQCASLMSPWELYDRKDSHAETLREAGFALQLPAQLPPINALMLAVRATQTMCPVINCSYPDVTHPILASRGLAPTVGVGNSGMLQRLMTARLGISTPHRQLRTLAHHAHVGLLSGRSSLPSDLLPRYFLDDIELAPEDMEGAPRLSASRELNALSAAHALDLIAALALDHCVVRTSAPGPFGLPGGWPIVISRNNMSLDLPGGLDLASATNYQIMSARLDGIERIERDGTVVFTDWLQAKLPIRYQALAAPLRPDDAIDRYRLLRNCIDRVLL